MYRTTNGFDKLSLPAFIQAVNDISTGMTGNAHFPDLQDDMIAFNNDKADYIFRAQTARSGNTGDILIRNAKRAFLVAEMRVLGNNVTAVCEGNVVMLQSSGFPVLRDPQTTPDLTMPVPPKVNAGINKGDLNCFIKTQAGTINILYMISSTPDVESSWNIYSFSGSSHTFTNLTSGTRYYIKYAICGVRKQQVMSETVSYIAQ